MSTKLVKPKKEDFPAPTVEEAKAAAEEARRRAAIVRDEIIFELHTRLMQDKSGAITLKQLLETGAFVDKVVGDSKREDTPQGPGFSITINLPATAKSEGKTYEHTGDEAIVDLGAVPASIRGLFSVSEDLMAGEQVVRD